MARLRSSVVACVPCLLALAAPARADETDGLPTPPRHHLAEPEPGPLRPATAPLWPPWRHGLAEVTDLASSGEPHKVVDVRVAVGYLHREVRGQLKREVDGAVAAQDSALSFRDLTFARSRDELSLRVEVGLFRDLMLHAELPIVLSDQTSLSYDRTASPCTLPPVAGASCVAAGNSSTVADGIAPANGYDATHGGDGIGDPVLFRGVRRGAVGGSGADVLDTFSFGLSWAPLSQRRDPSKPTWVLMIEPRLSVGTVRAFDRAAPDANHGVADGVHRIAFRTAVSRRIGRFEPYASLFYLLPIARAGSAFEDYGSAQKIKDPQHQAGGAFGAEIVAYEEGGPDWRVVVDLRGRLEGHFAGRGYSEAWELFAGSPALRCDEAQNSACDPSATRNAYQGRPHTGVTAIDGYATLGVELAVDALMTRFFRLRIAFGYARDQSHLVTGDDVGTPTLPGGKVAQAAEFNPAYRPVIDQVGRRYAVDNVDTFDARVTAQVRF